MDFKEWDLFVASSNADSKGDCSSASSSSVLSDDSLEEDSRPMSPLLPKVMGHDVQEEAGLSSTTPRPPWWRRHQRLLIFSTLFIAILVLFLLVIHLALVAVLISHIRPSNPINGLYTIVQNWREPTSPTTLNTTSFWQPNFSRDILPRPMHSHNDYWRSVPLFLALLNGASSVEADIWVQPSGELLVGHTARSLSSHRTLNTLYLDPLTEILTQQNKIADYDLASTNTNTTSTATAENWVGVFDTHPNQTLTLLLDVKTAGAATWPAILAHLAPLRRLNLLTRWNGTHLLPGPLTVVGSGNTPFSAVAAAEFARDRFVFFDAPLEELEGGLYDESNSWYASVEWGRGGSGLGGEGRRVVEGQVRGARERGLRSRYWGTPGWPVSRRDAVWESLVGAGVGVLNVDDVSSAGRWNWNWCYVAGLRLCGNNISG